MDSIELQDSTAALGKLNKQAVFHILHGAWKTRASFTISPWNDNLFLFTFVDSENRSWVLQKAPWSIMGHLLILQPLEVGLPVSEIQFNWCPFWVQIHGLLVEKMTKANEEIIGHKLGRLLCVEAHCEGLLLYRNFLRIRVEIDVTKPLPRGFVLNRGVSPPVVGSNSWISFKYEKLSDFCFDCGRIGHERTVCKFVSRDEGRASGYGLGLRTGIARSSGLSVEHYGKKVDELAAQNRPNLNHLSPSQSSSESVVARGDKAGEKMANGTEAGQPILAPVPTLDNLVRPISIVELSPPSSLKADLKTIVLDECMFVVFNTLTLKCRAPEVEKAFAKRPKLLKGAELTNIPVALLDIPSSSTSNTVSTRSRSSTRNETLTSAGKGRRAGRVKLFDIQVKEASSEHNGAMEAVVLGNLSSIGSEEYSSQVPSTYPYSSEFGDGNGALVSGPEQPDPPC
ncbi:hypothetical protein ACSBR2_036010 [Camellia fascicularis]